MRLKLDENLPMHAADAGVATKQVGLRERLLAARDGTDWSDRGGGAALI
jgi:hypothetical protein